MTAVSGGECKQLQHPCKGSVVPSSISPQVMGLHSFYGTIVVFPVALTLSVQIVKYVGVLQVAKMILNLLFLWLTIEGHFSLEKIQGIQWSYASNILGMAG